MRSKAQLVKTASTLKTFSTKIKAAQEGETLTPEAVQEIALEIAEVAEVASELAEEIAENVPTENGNRGILDETNRNRDKEGQPDQIETAVDETEEEKEKRKREKEAAGHNEDEDDELKEKVAKLTKELTGLKREAKLAKLAPKYATLFPKNMYDAKFNEIVNSKDELPIVEAKILEANNIITNKTMVKIASQTDSIFDFESDSEEVNIAAKM